MAITTLAGAITGMCPSQYVMKGPELNNYVGAMRTNWYALGSPPTGTLTPPTTAGGVALSSSSGLVQGQIPRFDPPAGKNAYLGHLTMTLANVGGGGCLLADRIMVVAGDSTGTAISVTSLSTQTINSNVISGNRDANGGNTGAGVLVALESSSFCGAAPTGTILYTGDVNGAGQVGVMMGTGTTWGNNQGNFVIFSLASGDTGVKSVESLTLGASMVSGSIIFVFWRFLAGMDFIPNVTSSMDAFTMGFPRIYDGTVPFIIKTPNGASNGNTTCIYTETQG